MEKKIVCRVPKRKTRSIGLAPSLIGSISHARLGGGVASATLRVSRRWHWALPPSTTAARRQEIPHNNIKEPICSGGDDWWGVNPQRWWGTNKWATVTKSMASTPVPRFLAGIFISWPPSLLALNDGCVNPEIHWYFTCSDQFPLWMCQRAICQLRNSWMSIIQRMSWVPGRISRQRGSSGRGSMGPHSMPTDVTL